MLLPRGLEVAVVIFSIVRVVLSTVEVSKDVVCQVQGNSKAGSQSRFFLFLRCDLLFMEGDPVNWCLNPLWKPAPILQISSTQVVKPASPRLSVILLSCWFFLSDSPSKKCTNRRHFVYTFCSQPKMSTMLSSSSVRESTHYLMWRTTSRPREENGVGSCILFHKALSENFQLGVWTGHHQYWFRVTPTLDN